MGSPLIVFYIYSSYPKTADLLELCDMLFPHTRAIQTPPLLYWWKCHLIFCNFLHRLHKKQLSFCNVNVACWSQRDVAWLTRLQKRVLPCYAISNGHLFILWAQTLGSLVCVCVGGVGCVSSWEVHNYWQDKIDLTELLTDSLNASLWQWWDKLCWQKWQPKLLSTFIILKGLLVDKSLTLRNIIIWL